MKKIISFFILAVTVQLSVFCQTTREEVFENIEKAGGVYYAYPVKDPTNTPVPKGYEPFYISHYGRHGSRYLISDNDYEWVINLMKDAQGNKALTPLGEDVLARLNTIYVEAEGRGGDLSPLGVRQHRGIAERMFRNYPQVFKGETEISARSTIVVRCVLSMDAFCERLKELNPKLKITRESSNRYMNYLNYHSSESNKFTAPDGPWREEYRKFEEAHTRPERLVQSLFSDNDYITKKVNPKELMWGLYWIAIDMQNMETPVSFMDIFEKQELFDLWQAFNYRFYVCDSNYKGNNGMMLANSKPQLRNIIETADQVIKENTNGATLRFGHDGNLIPLAGLLHFKDCYNSVSDPYEFYKHFSDFKIAPMAGNIQIIFFRNKKDSSDIIVKFLHNEKETSIPVETDNFPFYKWKDVKEFYSQLLKDN